MISSHHARGEGLRRKLTTTALLGATGLALLATAPAADAAVQAGRSVEVFSGSNFVGLAGYPGNRRVDVRILRGGVPVAAATNRLTTAAGALELNHGGGADCFDAPVSPDLRGGDVVEVTTTGDAAGVTDTMTVRDVFLDIPAMSITGNVVTISGRVGAAGGYGFRLVFDAAARHDSVITLPAGPFTRTVTLTPAQAAEFGVAEASLDSDAGNGELTVSDGISGALPGCPPIDTTAITSLSAGAINLANNGQALTVTGIGGPDVTAVSITGAGAAVPATVTTQDDGSKTWSATIPAGQVSALPQGPTTLTATFTGATQTTDTRIISKDTLAPAAPTAGRNGNAVSLSGDGASTIRYTNDGSAATDASTAYNGIAIQLLTGTTRIRAVAIDAAGNPSAPFDQSFTVDPPQQNTTQTTTQQTQPQQQVQAPAPIVITAPIPVAAPSRSLTARSLSLTGSRKLRTVRRNGLKFGVRVSGATRFLGVRLVRVSGKKRTVVTTRTLRVRIGGLFSGTLKVPASLKAGKYELEVAPADSNKLPGRATKATFRIA